MADLAHQDSKGRLPRHDAGRFASGLRPLIVAVILATVTVACAEFPSDDWYQEPAAGAGSLSVLECYRSGSPNIIVLGIDGRYAGCSKLENRRRVTAGAQHIVLYARNDSYSPHGIGQHLLKRYQAKDPSNPVPLPDMSFPAVAGHTYRIHGYFRDDLAEYWITDDDTGKIVSISRISRGDARQQPVAEPGLEAPVAQEPLPRAGPVPSDPAEAGAGGADIYCRPSFSYAGACGQSDPNSR